MPPPTSDRLGKDKSMAGPPVKLSSRIEPICLSFGTLKLEIESALSKVSGEYPLGVCHPRQQEGMEEREDEDEDEESERGTPSSL